LQFGWVNKNGLVPVYFDGQTSSDFLQDLNILCINFFIIVVCKSVRIGVVAREISLTGTEFRTREILLKTSTTF
jgi:hypothetical protein